MTQQASTTTTETGLLTKATEEKGVALKKPKKTGVSWSWNFEPFFSKIRDKSFSST